MTAMFLQCWAQLDTRKIFICGVAFTVFAAGMLILMYLYGLFFGLQLNNLIVHGRIELLLCNGIIIPILEELVWRGHLLESSKDHPGLSWRILTNSILFSLYHLCLGDNLSRQIFIFLIGLYLGIVYIRLGLLYSMISHITMNTLATIVYIETMGVK